MKFFTFSSINDALERRGWFMKRILLPYRYFESVVDRSMAPMMFEVEVVTVRDGEGRESRIGLVREDVVQKICRVTGASQEEFQEYRQ